MDTKTPPQPNRILVENDGLVEFYEKVISPETADLYFQQLMQEIAWENDRVKIFGKEFVTNRMVGWYGDEAFLYKYSNTTKTALPWTALLLEIKSMVENVSHCSFNSCLLNLYPTGEDAVGWHSDSEKELQNNGTIAALSLGAIRRFDLKHKITKELVSIDMLPGSLLLMKGETQKNWVHRISKTKKVKDARVSLTFRTVVSKI
ncbi:MAG: alpha-ketoglutarate-dependent dioxygenase AlkB [Weeksellaceae bacterium]|nr:alpha-ketoglutarate-dependent dioxygenase AlkB [Weeksellaceae bacterium]